MDNKILLEVFIPLVEESYDVFVPVNKTMGTIKKVIEKGIVDLSDNGYAIKNDTNLYSKETGEIYNVNLKLTETNLKNGSQVILI